MSPDKKNKIIGRSSFIVMAILYLCAFLFAEHLNDEEQRALKSYRYLLYHSFFYYFPIFPLVTIFISAPILSMPKTKLESIVAIVTINTIITACFTLFAFVTDFMFLSWMFILIDNIIFLTIAIYSINQEKK